MDTLNKHQGVSSLSGLSLIDVGRVNEVRRQQPKQRLRRGGVEANFVGFKPTNFYCCQGLWMRAN